MAACNFSDAAKFGFDAAHLRGILAHMKSGTTGGFIKSLLFLSTLSWSLHVTATTVFVDVRFFRLSPDPVNIKVDDSVVWIGDDDDFPYIISGPWGNLVTPDGITFLAQGSYHYSASWTLGGGSWGGTVNVGPKGPNSLPVVTITNPTNNAVFTAPATFAFEADASDADPDDLWDVEFWVNDEMVDDVFDPPYATTVTDLPAGTYTLTAIAWDFSLATVTNSITITVAEGNPITLAATTLLGGNFEFTASGLTLGKELVLETSTNLASAQSWVALATNVAESSTASFTNQIAPGQHFFRVVQLP